MSEPNPKVVPLRTLWTGELDESKTVVKITSPNEQPIFQVDGTTEPQFACGNCGRVLVVGDPLAAGYRFDNAILLLCPKCGAHNTVEAFNGDVRARQSARVDG